MESLACPKMICSLEINGGGLRDQPDYPGSSGQMAVKMECVCLFSWLVC